LPTSFPFCISIFAQVLIGDPHQCISAGIFLGAEYKALVREVVIFERLQGRQDDAVLVKAALASLLRGEVDGIKDQVTCITAPPRPSRPGSHLLPLLEVAALRCAPIVTCMHRFENECNETALLSIPGDHVEFEAVRVGRIPMGSHFPVDLLLRLKVGSLVRFCASTADVHQGDFGDVVHLSQDTVTVKVHHGMHGPLAPPLLVEVSRARFGPFEEDGEAEASSEVYIEQIPLALAHAVTALRYERSRLRTTSY
jgi:hypothetical protein